MWSVYHLSSSSVRWCWVGVFWLCFCWSCDFGWVVVVEVSVLGGCSVCLLITSVCLFINCYSMSASSLHVTVYSSSQQSLSIEHQSPARTRTTSTRPAFVGSCSSTTIAYSTAALPTLNCRTAFTVTRFWLPACKRPNLVWTQSSKNSQTMPPSGGSPTWGRRGTCYSCPTSSCCPSNYATDLDTLLEDLVGTRWCWAT